MLYSPRLPFNLDPDVFRIASRFVVYSCGAMGLMASAFFGYTAIGMMLIFAVVFWITHKAVR